MNSIEPDRQATRLAVLAGLGETPSLATIKRPAERAYLGIRRAILTGALKGGDLLGEEPLARMTGTSRTPVREALRRLVAEGLAVVENRHRFVSTFSYDEVIVVFEIRARLEAYAAAVAARLIDQGELAILERTIRAIDELDGATDAGSVERFVELNSRFHATIIAATRSRQLQTLSAQAVALPLVLIKQFVLDQSIDILRSNRQHRVIAAALAARDSHAAEAAMSDHILSTRPRRRPGSR